MERVEEIYWQIKDKFVPSFISPWLDEFDSVIGNLTREDHKKIQKEAKHVAIFISKKENFREDQIEDIKQIVDSFYKARKSIIPVLLDDMEQPPESLHFLRRFNCLRCHTDVKKRRIAEKIFYRVREEVNYHKEIDSSSQKDMALVRKLEEKDISLKRISDFLEKENYKAANEETFIYIGKQCNVNVPQNLRFESIDIAGLPVTVLRDIDVLWRTRTKGRFGFSAQKKVFVVDCKGEWNKSFLSKTEWPIFFQDDFCEKVGWQYAKKWFSVKQWKFTPEARPGHLPVWYEFTNNEVYKVFVRKMMDAFPDEG